MAKKTNYFDIPKSFECLGTTVKVKIKKLDTDKAGHFLTEESEIHIAPSNPEYMALTFFHEFLHCAAHNLGWPELDADEGKIDALAGAIVQLLKTKG